MGFAVSAWFDEALEQRVRRIWRTLHDEGLSSTFHVGPYRPHVTLGSHAQIDRGALTRALRERTAALPAIACSLPNVGVFPGPSPVLFLGLVPQPALLALHAAAHELLVEHASSPNAYYLPGRWKPHCTQAPDLDTPALPRAVALLAQLSLPLTGTIDRVGLIETPAEIELDVFPLAAG